MICAVARQRTIAAGRTGADEFKATIGYRVGYGATVKVNEAALSSNAVSVVTSAARGFLVHYMKPMATVLAFGICSMETLVTENAVPVMTFVTKRVVSKAFAAAVFENQLTL